MFEDRHEAGRQLAQTLLERHLVNPVVLALPRGGVPVAAEVAHALHAPLDLLFVRKIGAARNPELAVAAVAEGPVAPEVGGSPERIPAWTLDHEFELELREGARAPSPHDVTEQLDEIDRRRNLYLHGRRRVPICGRTVVVVDDGIATGTTLHAALRSVRAGRPSRVVVAVPVAPPQAIDRLRGEVDDVVCLETPGNLHAVSQFYRHFEQLTDEDVLSELHAPA